MSLFLFIFFSIYAAMHLLVWRGVRPLLPDHPLTLPLGLAWGCLMLVAPVVTQLLDRNGYETAARSTAWLGYIWLGFLFLAFSGFVVLGAGELLAATVGRLRPHWGVPAFHGPQSAALVVLVTFVCGCYALYEANALRTEEVRLASPRLPPELDGLRIVQISDLHLGLIHRQATAAKVAALIRQLRPDLLVATGDIVDGQISHLDGLSDRFRDIEAPLGKLAVLGNHEYYVGLPMAADFIRRSGFTLLRNESLSLRPGFAVIGLDDPAGRKTPETARLFVPPRRDGFVLLLKHRPDLLPGSAELFDLQLSGHTHRGQLAPFNLLTALEYPMQNGLYQLAGGGWLYASRGTGTWGPPMRLLSPPEVTLFILERIPSP